MKFIVKIRNYIHRLKVKVFKKKSLNVYLNFKSREKPLFKVVHFQLLKYFLLIISIFSTDI